MRITVDHPRIGEIDMPGSPMHFSESSTDVRRHPPDLGEHTEAILSESEFDDETVQSLEEDDVV